MPSNSTVDPNHAIDELWMAEPANSDHNPSNLEREDGEIAESSDVSPHPSFPPTPFQPHDPTLEWPGESTSVSYGRHEVEDQAQDNDVRLQRGVFRLLVSSSSVLSQHQRLVIIDHAYGSLELGRDLAPAGTGVPRVRLKEMAVSKLHTSVYWDTDCRKWGIVDMGSKHGTFVRAESSSSSSSAARLSGPRVASLPRTLNHLDEIALGSTAFIAHIHPDLPCTECSAQVHGNDLIPLFPLIPERLAFGQPGSALSAVKRKRAEDGMTPADARQSLKSLRRTLLSQHVSLPPQGTSSSQSYVDRSAKRRALHPEPRTDTPGTSRSNTQSPHPAPAEEPPVPPRPPPAIGSTNVGHQMLLKQGWTPGTALGGESRTASIASADPEDIFAVSTGSDEQVRLVEPLSAVPNAGRAGIGLSRPDREDNSRERRDLDWREEGRRRRWKAERTT